MMRLRGFEGCLKLLARIKQQPTDRYVVQAFTGEGGAPDDMHAQRAFAELSVVALARAVEVEGKSLPAGSQGTIVAAYSDGVGYEVEFEHPFHAVLTLEAADLAA